MKGRLLSIDVLRGMTLIFMIIVNQPGSWDNVFAPLLHADWNGLTPTDHRTKKLIKIANNKAMVKTGKRLNALM